MNIVSLTHSSALSSEALRSVAAAASKAAVQSPAASQSTPSTVLSLDTMTAVDVVYAKPAPLSTQRQAWASQTRDEVSTLMLNNTARSRVEGLAGQWRGLGSALLNQFAATGKDYSQTLVNYNTAAMAGSADMSTQALDSAALDSFGSKAAKASLVIQTRSGQTVELTIAVDSGQTLGRNGLQVEIKSSGPLSNSERKALAQLAQGLDQALEGLGQSDQPALDLSGLMDFDRSVLKSVDLSVKNPQVSQPLSKFSLHLGPQRNTVELQGPLGNVALSVDAQTPLGAVQNRQRDSAINSMLRQFDAAAERSHADSRLVGVFKDAFAQLHAAPAATESQALAVLPEIASEVQPLLSGLADFEARFSGDFERTGRFGGIVEMGHANYQLSQQTETKQKPGSDDVTVTQTRDEKLTGQYMKSRGGVMLDTGSGNYDVFTVEDRTRTSTQLATVEGKLDEATRQTDQQLLQTMTKLVNFRAEEERNTPRNKSLVENLL
ncbi:hypothetical protein [Acidovorax sp. CCYZU-2555]|uniref:hypothetical protein n=1 Tax=Acidovorax sp. CCYZU-2555 TaxID=2835042 RepID=UPI001BCCA750|nr:hypothetical protein [Acidovorax sp. CCYZU-2555]MBS7779720.1 hypothetical protein [Acidovorax sp. CCYZU-2555]